MVSNELIIKYDKLIRKIATKFYGVPFDDLYQVGYIGLMKAANNYQESNQCAFSTYAYKYIFGEMYYLVLKDSNFNISKEHLSLRKLINQTRDEMIQRLNREVTEDEIIKVLNISYDDYLMAVMSDNTLSLDYNNDESNELYNYLSDEDHVTKEELLMLKEGLEKLDDKSKEIIIKRYFYDYSQEEIASMYRMSQTSVSRYEKKLIHKLRTYVT